MKDVIIHNSCFQVVDSTGDNFDILKLDSKEKYGHTFHKFVVSNPAPKFSMEEIVIMIDLLNKAIEYGGQYEIMKKYINLLEKLTEEKVINE